MTRCLASARHLRYAEVVAVVVAAAQRAQDAEDWGDGPGLPVSPGDGPRASGDDGTPAAPSRVHVPLLAAQTPVPAHREGPPDSRPADRRCAPRPDVGVNRG